MHAAIRRYVDHTDLADQLARHESAVREVISGVDGFHAYYVVRASESTVTISIFDDAAGAEESTRRAAEWMRENLPDLAVEPPKVSIGEVVIAQSR
jgi:hypothetical protein